MEQREMEQIRKTSGISRISLRDIEHCFGLRAMNLGANPKVLSRYLGYRSGFNVMRYTGTHRAFSEENVQFGDAVRMLKKKPDRTEAEDKKGE